MKDIITITILALTLAFTLALSSTADAYTPTAEQCRQAGAYFNPATQGCDVTPPPPYTGAGPQTAAEYEAFDHNTLFTVTVECNETFGSYGPVKVRPNIENGGFAILWAGYGYQTVRFVC